MRVDSKRSRYQNDRDSLLVASRWEIVSIPMVRLVKSRLREIKPKPSPDCKGGDMLTIWLRQGAGGR